MKQEPSIWRLDCISKRYPGGLALDEVSMDIRGGEVHALCGENGAGKTTLMQILGGNLSPSSGRLLHQGRTVTFKDPLQARAAGVGIVHQSRSLFQNLSIAENIFAGCQPVNRFGLIDYPLLFRRTRRLLKELYLDLLEPDMELGRLPVAEQQMVELAKALAQHPALLILDEPTASVTLRETEIIFRIIRDLREQGTAVVYISHRMEEIFEIADRVTVLKDGKLTGTLPIVSATPAELIRLMVGRDIPAAGQAPGSAGETALELKAFSGKGFQDIHLRLHKGEIVGLAGLTGSGRTEMAQAIFGMGGRKTGKGMFMSGREIRIRGPHEAIRNGIGYLPEDRSLFGGFMEMGLAENIVSACLPAACRKGLFSDRRMHAIANDFRTKLRIASVSSGQKLKNLSGGNQQKALLAKWLLRDNTVLLVNEPTSGVDIAAKFDIYRLLKELAAAGKAILL